MIKKYFTFMLMWWVAILSYGQQPIVYNQPIIINSDLIVTGAIFGDLGETNVVLAVPDAYLSVSHTGHTIGPNLNDLHFYYWHEDGEEEITQFYISNDGNFIIVHSVDEEESFIISTDAEWNASLSNTNVTSETYTPLSGTATGNIVLSWQTLILAEDLPIHFAYAAAGLRSLSLSQFNPTTLANDYTYDWIALTNSIAGKQPAGNYANGTIYTFSDGDAIVYVDQNEGSFKISGENIITITDDGLILFGITSKISLEDKYLIGPWETTGIHTVGGLSTTGSVHAASFDGDGSAITGVIPAPLENGFLLAFHTGNTVGPNLTNIRFYDTGEVDVENALPIYLSDCGRYEIKYNDDEGAFGITLYNNNTPIWLKSGGAWNDAGNGEYWPEVTGVGTINITWESITLPGALIDRSVRMTQLIQEKFDEINDAIDNIDVELIEQDLKALRLYHYGDPNIEESPSEWFEFNPATGEIWDYNGPNDEHVVVPWEIGGVPVVYFGTSGPDSEGTFSIFSIRMPKTVKEIGPNAFQNVEHLTDVYLPAVETIGFRAFGNISSLTNVVFSSDAPSTHASGIYNFSFNVVNTVTDPTAQGWNDTLDNRPVVLPILNTVKDTLRAKIYADDDEYIIQIVNQYDEIISGRFTMTIWASLTEFGAPLLGTGNVIFAKSGSGIQLGDWLSYDGADPYLIGKFLTNAEGEIEIDATGDAVNLWIMISFKDEVITYNIEIEEEPES